MRALVQRVSNAAVIVDNQEISKIDLGLLVLLGVGMNDTNNEVEKLADKIAFLRIFADDKTKMNLSVKEVSGSILVVSQFTLFADTRKGRRPSFINAAPPEKAKPMVTEFCNYLRTHNIEVKEGVFGADMKVALTNDGPVTIWLDSLTDVQND